MKRILIILITIFTCSNLFGQVSVGYWVHKEILSTAKEKKHINNIDLNGLLNDNLFNYNKEKNINPFNKPQGIYLAFERTHINLQEITHNIQYYPLDSIGENSFYLLDERKYDSRRKYYKRIEILKNKILDYAIIKNDSIVKGGFLYKKWLNHTIFKYLPDIVFREFNKKTINNVGFVSINPFERTLSQYYTFNYKSNIYLNGLTVNSTVKHSTSDDRNGNAMYNVGFKPFTNFYHPKDKAHKSYNEYVKKCELIDSQRYYSIFIRYIGDEIIRKSHSLKYVKDKIKTPKDYNFRNSFNRMGIDSISNFLYESTFLINKNGNPMSRIENNIRVLSFRHKDTYYETIESIYGFYANLRGMIEIEKLFFIKLPTEIKECTQIKEFEYKYIDELNTLITKEFGFDIISRETDKRRKKIQYEKHKKQSLIRPYYECTAMDFIYEVEKGYEGFSPIPINYSLKVKFDYFPTVSENSSENRYINSEKYDKLIKKEYTDRIQKLNKRVCKELKGTFRDGKCECFCKTK